MRRIYWLIILLLPALLFSKQTKPVVFVSILPQKYFVERIAGDFFDVKVMVKPNENPATYEPTIKQLSSLKQCKLYFSIDVPFEKVWLPKIRKMYPNLRIVSTSKGITKRFMDNFEGKKNSKNPDPHIWLSPKLVKIQAKNIKEAFCKTYPEHSEDFNKNYSEFLSELDNLHNTISKNLSDIKVRKFAVFHPSWGYFADEFSLKQIPIEIEGKEPTPKQLKSIISILKRENIKVIFVQKQFSQKLAHSIAKQIGGKVIAIDPLAENFYQNLLQISKQIKDTLQ